MNDTEGLEKVRLAWEDDDSYEARQKRIAQNMGRKIFSEQFGNNLVVGPTPGGTAGWIETPSGRMKVAYCEAFGWKTAEERRRLFRSDL